MNLSGYLIRYFADSESGTFVFSNLQTTAVEILSGTTPSGQELRLGFTGITGNANWYFSFRNGKIYDPENRWFASYDENSVINISGDFTATDYDYYYNGEIICATGKKPICHVNGWFASGISGASATADIYIDSGPISCFLDMQEGFYLGHNWSGSFYHNNIGPVAIRSGTLFMSDADEFMVSGTGLSYCTGQNVVPSGGYRTIYLTHTGSQDRTGIYVVGVTVYTDFGFSSLIITGSGIQSKAGYLNNSFAPLTGLVTYTGRLDTGTFTHFFSTSLVDLNGTGLNKIFGVELNYFSGYTGLLSQVSGVIVSNGGAGYGAGAFALLEPTGGAFPFSSGTLILDFGNVIGLQWNTTGVYTGNTSLYSINIYNAGGGTSAVITPVYYPSYVKTFTGNVSLITGAIGATGWTGGLTVPNQTTISGQGTLGPDTNIAFFTVSYSGTPDTAPLYYTIIASGYYDTTTQLNLYTGSGIIVHS